MKLEKAFKIMKEFNYSEADSKKIMESLFIDFVKIFYNGKTWILSKNVWIYAEKVTNRANRSNHRPTDQSEDGNEAQK